MTSRIELFFPISSRVQRILQELLCLTGAFEQGDGAGAGGFDPWKQAGRELLPDGSEGMDKRRSQHHNGGQPTKFCDHAFQNRCEDRFISLE